MFDIFHKRMSLIVNFGKYVGCDVSELKKDTSYCDWLLKQEWFVSNKKYSKIKNSILGIENMSKLDTLYIIGDKTFKTQSEMDKYVRELIKSIGICDSVIKISDIVFNELLLIVNRHPDKDKIKNIVDFKIVNNKLNRHAYELNIIKSDGVIEDISWKICVSGKKKSNKQQLHSAYRYSVDEQIYSFKQIVSLEYCSLCKNKCSLFGGAHIDHVIHFEKMCIDFQNEINIIPPSDFDTALDGSNRHIFKNSDSDYDNAWRIYHKNNAILRVLCRDCNLKREKYSEH